MRTERTYEASSQWMNAPARNGVRGVSITNASAQSLAACALAQKQNCSRGAICARCGDKVQCLLWHNGWRCNGQQTSMTSSSDVCTSLCCIWIVLCLSFCQIHHPALSLSLIVVTLTESVSERIGRECYQTKHAQMKCFAKPPSTSQMECDRAKCDTEPQR